MLINCDKANPVGQWARLRKPLLYGQNIQKSVGPALGRKERIKARDWEVIQGETQSDNELVLFSFFILRYQDRSAVFHRITCWRIPSYPVLRWFDIMGKHRVLVPKELVVTCYASRPLVQDTRFSQPVPCFEAVVKRSSVMSTSSDIPTVIHVSSTLYSLWWQN